MEIIPRDRIFMALYVFKRPTTALEFIDTAGDQDLYQQDLVKLQQWSVRNSKNFNVKICKLLRITNKTLYISSFFHGEHNARGG